MNTYCRYIIFLLLSSFLLPVMAQDAYKGKIKYNQLEVKKQNKQLTIKFQIDLSSVELSNQRIIELTPVLKEQGGNELHFNPYYVSGRTREKVIERNGRLKDLETGNFVVRKNGKDQKIPVTLTLPFQDWMYASDLYFEEKIQGCAQCELGEDDYLVSKNIVPAKFIPVYELQHVRPEVEIPKRRSETFNALLSFKVGKFDLNRDFQNNATILNEVDKIVREINNDKNLSVEEMAVTGYASPEGNYNNNYLLSEKRTHSFVDYLVNNHHIDKSIIQADWKGEDWEGLKKSIINSSLADRDMVVRIIDSYPDVNQRKKQLQSLNGGSTYRILLNDYYPSLRRTEYRFSYIARQFDVEEAKEVIKTKPQYLSLNEMFLVAQTYEKGSDEFNHIFDVAVRLFPDNEVANLNAAVQEINNGSIDKAISRLRNIQTNEAWNNLGVAYAKNEQYGLAQECFNKAVQAGNGVARRNLEQLKRLMEDLD